MILPPGQLHLFGHAEHLCIQLRRVFRRVAEADADLRDPVEQRLERVGCQPDEVHPVGVAFRAGHGQRALVLEDRLAELVVHGGDAEVRAAGVDDGDALALRGGDVAVRCEIGRQHRQAARLAAQAALHRGEQGIGELLRVELVGRGVILAQEGEHARVDVDRGDLHLLMRSERIRRARRGRLRGRCGLGGLLFLEKRKLHMFSLFLDEDPAPEPARGRCKFRLGVRRSACPP